MPVFSDTRSLSRAERLLARISSENERRERNRRALNIVREQGELTEYRQESSESTSSCELFLAKDCDLEPETIRGPKSFGGLGNAATHDESRKLNVDLSKENENYVREGLAWQCCRCYRRLFYQDRDSRCRPCNHDCCPCCLKWPLPVRNFEPFRERQKQLHSPEHDLFRDLVSLGLSEQKTESSRKNPIADLIRYQNPRLERPQPHLHIDEIVQASKVTGNAENSFTQPQLDVSEALPDDSTTGRVQGGQEFCSNTSSPPETGRQTDSTTSVLTVSTSLSSIEVDDTESEMDATTENICIQVAESLILSWLPSQPSLRTIAKGHNNASKKGGKTASSQDNQILPQGSGSTARSKRAEDTSNLTRKHKADANDDEDEEQGARKRQSRDESNPCDGLSKGTRLLACPFFKFQPERYSPLNEIETQYSTCSGRVIRDIPNLKQHLSRTHARPKYYCCRCFKVFKDNCGLSQHGLAETPCAEIECPFPQKMTEKQAGEIRQREMGTNIEKKWYDIYQILFPDSPLPSSPYRNDCLEPYIQDFLGHFRRHAPQMVRAEMANEGHDLGLQEQRILDCALERALQRIIQLWETQEFKCPQKWNQGQINQESKSDHSTDVIETQGQPIESYPEGLPDDLLINQIPAQACYSSSQAPPANQPRLNIPTFRLENGPAPATTSQRSTVPTTETDLELIPTSSIPEPPPAIDRPRRSGRNPNPDTPLQSPPASVLHQPVREVTDLVPCRNLISDELTEKEAPMAANEPFPDWDMESWDELFDRYFDL